MTSLRGPDPIEAMEQFLGRVAVHDPQPGVMVMSVRMQVGRAGNTFELTARAAHPLTEALARYVDPDDCGSCAHCGDPLDRDMHCRNCGRLDGIFGQTVAHHAADVLRRHRGNNPRNTD